jgi:hypothetical protein
MFEWLFGKKVEEVQNDSIMFGFDLNKWNYLGYTTISYNTSHANIHFFSDKENDDIRKYFVMSESRYIDSDYFKKYHGWINTTAELWRICEHPLYMAPSGNPSKYLKDYMLKNFAAEWLEDENGKFWWRQTIFFNQHSKNNQSTSKAKAKIESKDVVKEETDNIIKVEFNKKPGD